MESQLLNLLTHSQRRFILGKTTGYAGQGATLQECKHD